MINYWYGKSLQKDFFKLSILTLVTVVIWIGLSVYRSLTFNYVKPEVKKLLSPLTPNLDLDTIEKIKQLEVVPEVDWYSFQPAQPEILVAPEASFSATSSAR